MKKWKILNTQEAKNAEEIVKIILQNRSISPEEKDLFLTSHLSDITPEMVGIKKSEIEKAKKRIEKAIQNGEQIIIFGDYDADGICAAAIMWETLFEKSKKVLPYIPERAEEGYGISIETLDNIFKKHPDTTLIITVDNGIVAHEAVAYAKKKGVDTIITDHHTKDEKYPDACAVIYTDKLCGAAISWMLAREIADNRETIEKSLDLVAIATVADLVPLTGTSRILVREGLKQLAKTTRIGLKQLIEEARILNRKVGVYDIGFLIAPRLNAAGRISHAIESLRLLCTKNKDNARIFAGKLGAHNRKRQTLTNHLTQHAKNNVQQDAGQKVYVVHHKTYEEGVIGLIASKLVEEFYRPALVISVGEEISKGSARSIPGVNIVDLIKSADKYIEKAGGHPMAAGFSLKTKNLEDFKKAIVEKSEEFVTEESLVRELKIDLQIPLSVIDFNLHEQLQQLYPFGIGNPEPVFSTKSVTVKNFSFVGKDASHLKLLIENEGVEIETIGFGLAKNFKSKNGDKIDIAYSIDINEWMGKKKINLKIKDINAKS